MGEGRRRMERDGREDGRDRTGEETTGGREEGEWRHGDPVEREARTWGNRYAVLSETTADVRHVHSGECSMVKQRLERVQGLRGERYM